ncbi:hypothetical protein Ancab_026524 [Ancistrocladus abbreviatus]
MDHSEDDKTSRTGSLKKKATNASSKFKHSLTRRRSSSKVMSVDIEDIHDAEEVQAVDGLRQAFVSEDLLPSKHDDYHMMLRFLRARKFDLKNTKRCGRICCSGGRNLVQTLLWRYRMNTGSSTQHESGVFELTFDKKHKDKVLNAYLPHIMSKAKTIKEGDKVLKLCTLGSKYHGGNIYWETINLEHPSTFDTLAMDPKLKKEIIDDLDMFVRRREYYKRVGRAWKRGYLLYGPPGTGKSSLIAAIANHLKFDIYDLQLGNFMRDSDLGVHTVRFGPVWTKF